MPKYLKKLAERKRARLAELKAKMEKNEVRSEDLATVQAEVAGLSEDLKEIAEAQAEATTTTEEDHADEVDDTKEEEQGEEENAQAEGEKEDQGNEPNLKDGEQRSTIMAVIGSALSTRNAQPTKRRENEIRKAFADFVIGKIDEKEARSLGIVTGNGAVTIPDVIASEVITYAQEANLLRKYGTVHKTKGNVKFPILVKKADANVRKKERGIGDEIEETGIEFDEIYLEPSEFDALVIVTRKLLNQSNAPIETIIIEELRKTYIRKETNYMFNGDDVGHENPGALAKKAVPYYEKIAVEINKEGWSQRLYPELVKMKNQPVTEVLKKSMWIVNRAALTLLESMVDTTGRPLLHVDATDGVTYKLLGHKLDFTDAADAKDSGVPVFYFGDFSAFYIQDVMGSLGIQKMVETYARTNRIGFQIYNLLDGQLVYSPFEPAVYRYEIGQKAPTGGKEPESPTPTPTTTETPTSTPPKVEYRAAKLEDLTKHNDLGQTFTVTNGNVASSAAPTYGENADKTAFLLPEAVKEMKYKAIAPNLNWVVIGSDGTNTTLMGLGKGANSANVANGPLTDAGTLTQVKAVADRAAMPALYDVADKGHTYTVGTVYRVVNSADTVQVYHSAATGEGTLWFTLKKAGLTPTVKYADRLGFVAGISPNNDHGADNVIVQELNIKA